MAKNGKMGYYRDGFDGQKPYQSELWGRDGVFSTLRCLRENLGKFNENQFATVN